MDLNMHVNEEAVAEILLGNDGFLKKINDEVRGMVSDIYREQQHQDLANRIVSEVVTPNVKGGIRDVVISLVKEIASRVAKDEVEIQMLAQVPGIVGDQIAYAAKNDKSVAEVTTESVTREDIYLVESHDKDDWSRTLHVIPWSRSASIISIDLYRCAITHKKPVPSDGRDGRDAHFNFSGAKPIPECAAMDILRNAIERQFPIENTQGTIVEHATPPKIRERNHGSTVPDKFVRPPGVPSGNRYFYLEPAGLVSLIREGSNSLHFAIRLNRCDIYHRDYSISPIRYAAGEEVCKAEAMILLARCPVARCDTPWIDWHRNGKKFIG